MTTHKLLRILDTILKISFSLERFVVFFRIQEWPNENKYNFYLYVCRSSFYLLFSFNRRRLANWTEMKKKGKNVLREIEDSNKTSGARDLKL